MQRARSCCATRSNADRSTATESGTAARPGVPSDAARRRRARPARFRCSRIPLDENAAEVRTLLGTAYARSGDVERGLTLLHEAKASTTSVRLRAEIALGVALAHYARRDFALAERALDAVAPSAAPSTRARSNAAAGSRSAVASFRPRWKRSKRRWPSWTGRRSATPFSRPNLVMVLGNLAVELLDEPRWDEVVRRGESIAWEGPGLAYYRFWQSHERIDDGRDVRPSAGGPTRRAERGAESPLERVSHVRALPPRGGCCSRTKSLLGYADLAGTRSRRVRCDRVSTLRAFEEINLVAVVVATLAQIGDAARCGRDVRASGADVARVFSFGRTADRRNPSSAATWGTSRASSPTPTMTRSPRATAIGILSRVRSDRSAAPRAARGAASGQAHGDPRRWPMSTRCQSPAGDLVGASSQPRPCNQRRRGTDLRRPLTSATRRARAVYEGRSTAEIAVHRGRSTQTFATRWRRCSRRSASTGRAR